MKNMAESAFLLFKDRGGLFKPSKSVIQVCEETEKCFRRMLASNDGHLPQCSGMSEAIQLAVLQNLNGEVFTEFFDHMLECAIEDNHIYNLIKLVARSYAKIRFYHLGQLKTTEISEPKIRKKLNKLILFKNQ